MVEPIQGEAGIIVPPENYLGQVQQLCKKYNILLICDEIQTGMARTGKLFAFEHDLNEKPDMVIVGKALSGGVLPLSAVLGREEVMMLMKPGQHGSTFGGNSLAAAVGKAALTVIVEEGLCEQAQQKGELLKNFLIDLQAEFPLVLSEVRGRGMLRALEFDRTRMSDQAAKNLCFALKDAGVLTKPTHSYTVRLAPPLVITHAQLDKAFSIIRSTMRKLFAY